MDDSESIVAQHPSEIRKLIEKLKHENKMQDKIINLQAEQLEMFHAIRNIEHKVNKLDTCVSNVENKVDRLDVKFNRRIDKLDQKFDKRIDELEQKFDKRIDKLEKMKLNIKDISEMFLDIAKRLPKQ